MVRSTGTKDKGPPTDKDAHLKELEHRYLQYNSKTVVTQMNRDRVSSWSKLLQYQS